MSLIAVSISQAEESEDANTGVVGQPAETQVGAEGALGGRQRDIELWQVGAGQKETGGRGPAGENMAALTITGMQAKVAVSLGSG